MGLADIIRSGIGTINTVTATLQAPVKHYTYSAATIDDSGMVTWGPPIVRMGLVEHARARSGSKEDREVTSTTTLTFPQPFDVDPRDRFELPDGSKDGPATRIGGVVDPLTNKIYMTQVWI